MVGALEDLSLFGNGLNHRFKRRAFIEIAESSSLHLCDGVLQSSADRAKVQALLPKTTSGKCRLDGLSNARLMDHVRRSRVPAFLCRGALACNSAVISSTVHLLRIRD
jgi:hypothetical protein